MLQRWTAATGHAERAYPQGVAREAVHADDGARGIGRGAVVAAGVPDAALLPAAAGAQTFHIVPEKSLFVRKVPALAAAIATPSSCRNFIYNLI